MRHRLFITGTDTHVGKTQVAAALLQLAKQKGLSTAALKPIAAGCEDGRNADAVLLQQLTTIPLGYDEVNPVALKQAIAPHLAAYAENKTITVERLAGFSQNIFSKKANFTVIEGAGGWRVPLNHRELMSDYVKHLHLPVLLVVGMRLGCLNHTLLTVEAIKRDNLPLVGWIANGMDPHMEAMDENIQTLQRWLPMPCLGVIPWQKNAVAEQMASKINWDELIKAMS